MMKKRILLFLLAILCLAGIGIGHQAFAAEVIAGEEYNSFYNVSWKLTDDGVMTVCSQRTIHGGKDGSVFPWYQYREKITKIVIESPTEWIGAHVFSGLENVEEVVLPKSLKTIYNGAFAGCSKLKSVESPDSVEQIGAGAFAGCTSLERIKLPANSNYTTVQERTFAECPLVELDIPDQITMIEGGAFSNCTKLKGLRIGKDLRSVYRSNFNDAAQLEWVEIYCDTFIELTEKEHLRSVVLGPGVANSVFTDCPALETVVLHEGVTYLRSAVFQGCTALTNIQLPSTLTEIGDRAFYGCPIEKLELPNGLLQIGRSAFVGTKLRELTIPATVQSLQEDALSIITLEKIVFLGDAPEAPNCPMTYAAPTAYYPAGNSTWTEESKLALGFSAIWQSICPNGEELDHMFSDWNIVLQPTMEATGWEKRSCSRCGEVQERIIQRLETQEPPVTLPTEPTEPAEPTEPTVSEPSEPVQQPSEQNGAPWYLLVAGAVVIAVMAVLLVVKKRAAVCLLVVLLAAVPWTVAVAAQQSGIQWEYDAVTGTATATGEGTLTRQGFYDQFGDQPLRHLIIGEGILEIGPAGFMECMELESVAFPESLQVIGRGAFEQCYNLKSLEFPDGLLILGIRAFYACENVSQITFGSKLRSIGADCFSAIQQVEQVQLPDSLLYIGNNAFLNCIALQRVSLGAELSYLGARAFAGCGSLQSIHVSRENRYFSDLDGVLLTADGKTLLCYPKGRGEEYTIPACVTKIVAEAFIYCQGLKTIHIPGTVESIGESAFLGCYAMTCVDMAEGVLEIGNYAFSQCLELQTLTIPASVRKMNFSIISASGLRQVVFLGERPESVQNIQNAFGLTVYFPVGDSSWDAVRDEASVDPSWRALCAGDHTPVTLPGKAGNCLEKGMTDGVSCSECGLLIKPQEALPLGDHDFSQWELVKSPTEIETGIEERVCSCCGEKEERSVEKLSPPPPVEEKTDMWLIMVLVLVEVCFVGVEVYLLLRKKKMKVK